MTVNADRAYPLSEGLALTFVGAYISTGYECVPDVSRQIARNDMIIMVSPPISLSLVCRSKYTGDFVIFKRQGMGVQCPLC